MYFIDFRYFKLLARYNDEKEKMTPLSVTMKLLINEKAENSVTSCISSMLENLLTLQENTPNDDDEQEENYTPIEVDFILPVEEDKISKLNRK